jgi:ribosomal protein L24
LKVLLLKAENIHSSNVMVICHAAGQGTEKDLNLLMADLKSESFTSEIQASGPDVWDEILRP